MNGTLSQIVWDMETVQLIVSIFGVFATIAISVVVFRAGRKSTKVGHELLKAQERHLAASRLSVVKTTDIENNDHVEFTINSLGLATDMRVELRDPQNVFNVTQYGLQAPPTSYQDTYGEATPCVEDDVETRVVAVNDAGVTYGPWIYFEENCHPT